MVYQISLYLCQDLFLLECASCEAFVHCICINMHLKQYPTEIIRGNGQISVRMNIICDSGCINDPLGALAPIQHLSLPPLFPTGSHQCQCPPLCSTSLLSLFTFTLALSAEHEQLCFHCAAQMKTTTLCSSMNHAKQFEVQSIYLFFSDFYHSMFTDTQMRCCLQQRLVVKSVRLNMTNFTFTVVLVSNTDTLFLLPLRIRKLFRNYDFSE